MQVYTDEKGIVRTVRVGYRRKDRREKQEYDRKYYEKKTSRFIIKKTGSKSKNAKETRNINSK